MTTPSPRPYALDTLEACRHAVAVLELEKAKHKLSARILALKLARAEVLLKQARKPAQDPPADAAISAKDFKRAIHDELQRRQGGCAKNLIARCRCYCPESTPVPPPVHPGEGGKEP